MNAAEKNRYLLIMRIGDRAAFDKVMSALVSKHILSKNGDQYQLGMAGGHDFAIETSGNDFVAGSSDELIKSYETGNGKSSLPDDVTKEMNNKSMAMYVDINAILQNMNTHDSSGEKALAFAQSTFKSFTASSEKGDGKTANGNFILNFKNANENSLASLTKFLLIAHEEVVARKENGTPIFLDSIPDMNKDEKDSQ